jgi:hypothetical protein
MASNINQIINCMHLINKNLNIDNNDKQNLLNVMLKLLNEVNNNNIKIEVEETEIVEEHEVDKETEIVEGPKIDDRIDCINSNINCHYIINNNDDWDNLYKYKNFDINDMSFVQELYKKCPNNDIIKYVINNCNNLNAKINGGFYNKFRPIHFVCYYANTEIIKFMIDLLIEKNIKLNPKTYMDSQPIHFICQRKDIESLKYLLSKKNHNNDLNLINKYYHYPITYVNSNDNDILNVLINNGAKIDFKNTYYWKYHPIMCIESLEEKKKYEINDEIFQYIFKNNNDNDKILLKKSNDKLKFIINTTDIN